MDFFSDQLGAGKVAKDLTANAVLMATSKYVKGGPTPVGTYEHVDSNPHPAPQRYGTGRRLKTKQDLPSKTDLGQDTAEEKIINVPALSPTMQSKDSIYSFTNVTAKVEADTRTGVAKQQGKLQESANSQFMVPDTSLNLGNSATKKQQPGSAKPGNQNPTAPVNRNLPKPDIFQLLQPRQAPKSGRYGDAQRSPRTEESVQDIQKAENTVASNAKQTKVQQVQKVTTPRTAAVRGLAGKVTTPVDKGPAPIEAQTPKQEASEPQNTDRTPKPLARTTGRAQLRTKPTANQNQQPQTAKQQEKLIVASPRAQSRQITPVGSRQQKKEIVPPVAPKQQEKQQIAVKQPVKRSPIVSYVLKNILRSKISQAFLSLKTFAGKTKKKQEKLSRPLINKLHAIYNKITIQNYQLLFSIIAKQEQLLQRPQDITNLTVNSQKILLQGLNRFYRRNLSQLFAKLRPKKRHSANRNLLLTILSRISMRKLADSLHTISQNTRLAAHVKTRLLMKVGNIAKSYTKYVYEQVFSKLSRNRAVALRAERKEKQKQKQASTPVAEFKQTPVGSPKKDNSQIQRLERQNQANAKKLKQLTVQYESQRQQCQSKIQNLTQSSQQIKQFNQQKERVSAQLKQKVESITPREENYIEDPDLVADSKFPLLYELYIKIQKTSINEIRVEDLASTFPSLDDDLRKDELLQAWGELQRNIQLKRQVNRYEGTPQLLSRAAKAATEENELITEMVRGYVKEKYTWQWVKNALQTTSASS